jgi:CheY-like chemotaxis protein
MKKPTILLVDDEAIVRDSISEWLKNSNFEVDCASNGAEALECVQHKRFDTAVVDLKMPGIDGLEVMRRVKQTAPQINIIIITAYGTVENAVEALKGGASDYLTKPFTLDKLEKAIENSYTKASTELSRTSSQATETITLPEPKTAPAPVKKESECHPERVEGEEKPKAKEKQCIWSKAGVISYRVCINNFKCDACEFAQTLMDKGAPNTFGDRPLMMDAMKKMIEKPGTQRPCRYTLSGDVSYKLCPNVYQCFKCSFDQQMQEKIDAKAEQMAARVKSMQERKAKKAGA